MNKNTGWKYAFFLSLELSEEKYKNKKGIDGCQSELNSKRSKAESEECFLAFFSDVVQQVKAD